MNGKKALKTPVKASSKIVTKDPKLIKPFRAQDYVSTNIPLDQVIAVKQAFDIFDTDKTGLLDPAELKHAFISLGFAVQNKFVLRMLNDYESQHSEGIQFGEFLKLSTAKLGDSGSRAQIQRVFNTFDIEKKGKISSIDMKRVAEEVNENLTDEQIEKMIIKADSDQDGWLTVDDFYNVLANANNTSEYD